MPNLVDQLSQFGPKISTIYLKLHDYQSFHASSRVEKRDKRIIGRVDIKEKLLELLDNDQTKSGTYLITGSRGMGKTSLVNDVLRRWINKRQLAWGRVNRNFILSTFIGFALLLFCSLEGVSPWDTILVAATLGLLVMLVLAKILITNRTTLKFNFFKNEISHHIWSIIIVFTSALALALVGRQFDFIKVVLLYSFGYYAFFVMYFLIKRRRTKLKGSSWLSKDIFEVRLDIGQEDIDETQILKQIVSKLLEKCIDIKRRVHFLRASIVWFIALFSSLWFVIDREEPLVDLTNAHTWASYFPSQHHLVSPPQVDSLEINYSMWETVLPPTDSTIVNHSGSVQLGYKNLDPQPSETFGILLENFSDIIRISANTLDRIIKISYDWIYPKIFVLQAQKVDQPYSKLNYALIIVFISLSTFLNYLTHFFLRLSPPYYITGAKQLNFLKRRIYAETSDVAVSGISQNKFINWSRRRTSTFPIAGKYEIQMEVQRIVNQMVIGSGWVPFLSIDRQIIFVMDELDKIEPEYYDNLDKKAIEEHAKTRQEQIAKTLQSLKSFFSHTEAKFIFIAGDDMYDASIADASNNREHSIDRLFNKVFYISSFYSDYTDKRKSNINSLTEAYVCQFLIPENELNENEGLNSKRYQNTAEENDRKIRQVNLQKYYSLFFKRKSNPSQGLWRININSKTMDDHSRDRKLENLIRVRVSYTLQNFISYLAYQSNGSPKKITSLFEEYIQKIGPDDPVPFSITITDDPENKQDSFFLRFTEKDQYKFGLINYLVTPFIISQKRFLTSFGDKLLVSTSFIIDHLYKYHDSAFSWKTLELTPEIIAINKAPQLRSFIKDVMFYFTRTHVDQITSGLFDFKFIGKIKSEIRYLSKVSDLEAAAFNFTLDESKQTKRHHRIKLEELREVYLERLAHIEDSDQKFVLSLTFANVTLGDLEFYDQEYNNAIYFYLDALQELELLIQKKGPYDINNFVIYLRNSLKLALAYEKQNHYDSALMTYERLRKQILSLRNIDIYKLGFRHRVVEFEDIPEFVFDQLQKIGFPGFKRAFYRDMNDEFSFKQISTMISQSGVNTKHPFSKNSIDNTINRWVETLQKNYRWNKSINLDHLKISLTLFYNYYHRTAPIVTVIDKSGNFYSFEGEHFVKTYFAESSFDKDIINTNNKLFAFENLRLLYQPFAASLSVLEKNGINSITNEYIKVTLRDFRFLSMMINVHGAYLVEMEFLNKIGDILYFKNGILKDSIDRGQQHDEFIQKLDIAAALDIAPNDSELRDYNMPVQGTIFYLLSLDSFWKGTKPPKINQPEKFYAGKSIEDNFYKGFKKLSQYKAYQSTDFTDKFIDHIESALNYLNTGVVSPKHTNPRSIKLNTLANCYSDLGDTILSSIVFSRESKNSIQLLRLIKKVLKVVERLNALIYTRYTNNPTPQNKKVEYLIKDFKDEKIKVYSFEGIVTFYVISSALYHKSYKNLKAAFQLQKIITLIDDYLFILSGKQEWNLNWTPKEAALRNEISDDINRLLLVPYLTKTNKAYHDSLWQDMAAYKRTGSLSDSHTSNHQVLKIQKVVETHLVPDAAVHRSLSSVQRILASSNGDINKPNIDFEFHKNASIASEQKEAYLLVEKIQHRLTKKSMTHSTYEQFSASLLSHPFVDVSNQMNRVHELFLRGTKCKSWYQTKITSLLSREEYYDLFDGPNSPTKLSCRSFTDPDCWDQFIQITYGLLGKYNHSVGSLISNADLKLIFLDAIYCYNELISKLNVIEPGFGVPSIYFGFAHYELAWWLEELEILPNIQYDVLNELKTLFDDCENDFINKQYQWAKAKYHFVTAMQTHKGMDPYTHKINDMYYLDDDFNDDQEHFYAAQERLHLNSGLIRDLCKELNFKINNADKLFGMGFYSGDFVNRPAAEFEE